MRRRQLTQLLGLLAASALIRYLLIPYVGVFGDFGFWAYDSRLILQGKTPYIDFTGRSPLTIYTLAAVRSIFGMSVYTMRATVILHWTATAAVVYAIASFIRDHRTGLLAVVMATLTPVPLVYGMWVNSQAQMALLAVLAVYTVLRWPTLRGYALAGAFVGLGLLARRSIIMVAAGIGVWTLWKYWRQSESYPAIARSVGARGVVAAVPALGLSLLGFGAVVGFYPPHAIELFRGEVLGLIFSSGAGSYPILGMDVPAASQQVEAGRVPVFNWLCQLCGAWTARVGFKMLILSLPVTGFFWWYTRDITDHHFTPRDRQYMYGALGIMALYALYLTATHGFAVRFVTILTIAAFAFIAYRLTDGLERELLYHPAVMLIISVTALLVLGYLYRNRRLHVYYLNDVWPFYAILASVIAERVWTKADYRARQALVGVVALAVVVSVLTAAPFVHVTLEANSVGWFTVANMADSRGDLNARTEPGDEVFTARPNYVVGTDVRLAGDISRSYKMGLEYADTAVSHRLYRVLRAGFRSGDIEYVILSNYTGDVLAWDNRTEALFEERYCRVPDPDGIYAATNAALYAPAEDCGTERPNVTAQRPPWNRV